LYFRPERRIIPRMSLRLLIASFVALGCMQLSGCAKEGCLDPVEGCVVPSPCQDLAFPTCAQANESLVVKIVESEDEVPGGIPSLGAVGDILLTNGRVTAILDALDHPHYISPTGGLLLDLSTTGEDNDSLRHVEHGVGVLPDEAFAYTSMELIQEPGLVGVQFRGTLQGRPDVPIATRYELRPCDPGVRVRTEVVNLEADTWSWTLSDAFYWGGRENVGFSPVAGHGFLHPSFGLSTLPDAIHTMPFMVAGAHTEPAATYFAVSCNADEPTLTGLQSEDLTLVGRANRVVAPRDYMVHERFIGVTPGRDLSPAVDLALTARGDDVGNLSGRVIIDTADGTTLPEGLRAVVHITEGTPTTPAEELIPWTQTRPGVDGTWNVDVPIGRDYLLEVEVYGVRTEAVVVTVDGPSAAAPDITLPAVGLLTIDGSIDAVRDHLLAFVHPADDATHDAVNAAMFGVFQECAPLLGPPHGESPACNRALMDGTGPTTVAVLPGNYDVFASAGPFTTLGAARGVTVTAGQETTVDLVIESLDLLPEGALSADFHVHGGASFDSSIPDDPRVASFLASRIDVIAATDHDAVWDYAQTMDDLGAHDRMHLMVGMETTGHILFDLIEEPEFPQVIGHWNMWPFTFDPSLPYNGGPWDELVLPGQLFTRAQAAGWPADTGVIQLNHPMSGFDFGRDTGWAAAMAIDGNVDLAEWPEGTLPDLLDATPDGSSFSNADYHAQEVMNGTDNEYLVRYRAYWHYLLDQGVVRAGTANSDSHSLGGNVLGTPRTLVWSDDEVGAFDEARFNQSIRGGRMIGTNGPVIEVSTTDDGGAERGPSLEAFVPGAGAELAITVSAAPWVPVTEVRVIVNSEVVMTFTAELTHPADPLGIDGLLRLDTTVPLADLIPASGDAWISVEAGVPLEPNSDLNCDGFPDTGDNNRDGVIDWQDVEGLEEDPETDCLSAVGPVTDPPTPTDRTSADYLFQTVVEHGFPMSFTNPLLIDRDADGFDGASR
jgi:hypothetical protein